MPLAGVAVVANGPNGSGSAVTDSSGRYQISHGLATGNYSLIASSEGYLDAQIDSVPVVGGNERSELNLSLKKSGAISGKVTDVTGSPMKGIVVTAVQTKGTGGNSSSYAFTRADGSYNIHTGLSTGSYNVIAGFTFEQFDPKYLKSIIRTISTDFQWTKIDHQAETMDGVVKGVFRNDYDHGVTAKVTETTMLIVPQWVSSAQYLEKHLMFFEQSVEAYFPPNQNVTVNIDTGVMKVPIDYQIPAEVAWAISYEYSIQISSAKGDNLPRLKPNLALTSGQETSGIDFQISIPASASISGRITDASGNAINAAMVYATGLSGFWTTKSDPEGRYLISEGLATGNYTVTAWAPGYETRSMDIVGAKANQVVNSIDFRLQQISKTNSGRISGQITGEPNPIPEFSDSAVPVIFSLVSLTMILASIKVRKIVHWQHGS